MKKKSNIPIITKTTLYRIAFSFLTFTGVQHAFGKGNPEMPLEAINVTDLDFMNTIMGDWIYSSEFDPCYGLPSFSTLEKDNSPKPEKEETKEDKEVPQKSPIIPILNRNPALHKKRHKGSEKDKQQKLPWR